jgi:hypothetical protein
VTGLEFAVVGAEPEPHALAPILSLRLRVTEPSGSVVHAAVLRCQVRIEPQRRRYAPDEAARLVEVFGERPQWGASLRPFLWAHAVTVLPRFAGETHVDLPITCTYDLEVASGKYLHALDGGDIPLVLLFNGIVFSGGGPGVSVEPVPWTGEASYRLPVAVYRELMDRYFPGSGWLRLSREVIDALGRYKAARALPTWEQAVASLLAEVAAR